MSFKTIGPLSIKLAKSGVKDRIQLASRAPTLLLGSRGVDRQALDAQLGELRAMRNGASQTAPASARPRRKMSAAGRKAIAAAQRQRWATLKGEGVAQVAPKKAKRKLSRAGRAAIVAALKKRWAAKKAAKKS
jgi:hypothetical protein